MLIEEGLLYTEDHSWIKEEDGIAYIGATDFGQEELEDVVFVDFPQVGELLEVDDVVVTLESVKATIDLYMDFKGEVLEINEDLFDKPELVNEKPYESWLVKLSIEDRGELDSLMNAEEYEALLRETE